MTALPVVAGIDSSTQSCTVLLLDLDGGIVAVGSAPHPPVTPPRSEQDPAAWWDALVLAFRRALALAGPGVEVRAVSVAAQCHGLVVLDEHGAVIRPAKLWNDTTSSPELRELVERIGSTTLVDTIGTLPTAAFTLSKVAWLSAHEPHHFERVATMLLPHDYLTFRLTGRRVTDRSEASGTGYYDAARGEYLFDHLRAIDPDVPWETMVPEVLAPDEAAGLLLPEVADELRLGRDVVVAVGGGDQHASALGLGIAPGDVVYSIGTSGVVFTVSDSPVRDYEGRIDGVADMTGRFLPLVSTLNAAKVTDAFARVLDVDHDTLSRLALAAPDRDGTVLVAYLDGERTPDRPNARGMLLDITGDLTREELARAAYEGVLLGLVDGHRRMTAHGVPMDGTVYAVGGGARSAAYTQLLADLLGREVMAPDAQEATARGAAVQAAAVLGGVTVEQQRDAWCPSAIVAARPRQRARDPWPVYSAGSALEELDDLTGGRS